MPKEKVVEALSWFNTMLTACIVNIKINDIITLDNKSKYINFATKIAIIKNNIEKDWRYMYTFAQSGTRF